MVKSFKEIKKTIKVLKGLSVIGVDSSMYCIEGLTLDVITDLAKDLRFTLHKPTEIVDHFYGYYYINDKVTINFRSLKYEVKTSYKLVH